jgi:hypothetical protein
VLRASVVTANVISSSPIFVAAMMEAMRSSKRQFLQEPHGLTTQKTTFFIVTAVKTSHLTEHYPAGLCSGDVICLL